MNGNQNYIQKFKFLHKRFQLRTERMLKTIINSVYKIIAI